MCSHLTRGQKLYLTLNTGTQKLFSNFSVWRRVESFPMNGAFVGLHADPDSPFGLECHPYLYKVPTKILKDPEKTYLRLYISYISQ